MQGLEFKRIAISAVLRLYYLDLYAKLESQIRLVFEESLNDLPTNILNKLYFYYGHTSLLKQDIDYSAYKAKTTHREFQLNEKFKEFQTAKIIRLAKADKFIDKFNFKINSFNKKTIEYDFFDALIKLINMRNILAHQQYKESFKDQEVIELLSDENIAKYNTFNLDDYVLSKDSVGDLQILSNLIYMQNIYKKLSEESY